MTTSKKIIVLIGWITLCSLAGIFGAQFEPGQWYELLQKPAWTPPDWVFPVVWPILYLLMGISAWFIWKKPSTSLFQKEFRWFYLQLLLNALWSWLFFGLHLIGLALAEIMLLWGATFTVIVLFYKKDRIAGILLIPYLIWVSYASALTFAIWQLN
ncbi:TspO/MBR family protein [Fodinibius salsisoli]|uniref:Tryptophan-rich sensory protein n=1 Tax=Fodinibius salsisoli TaxID=2820877 RepID=A0ABT3PMR3_9BACT|nr:TspO/MBR family protein [Fodinibius salsisoli]MCW9707231.1 tryptophan-rich sensory protein [Fodinibius salsisoli]